MTAYEMQTVANMVAEAVYKRLVDDEKFMRRITKTASKRKNMLNTAQAAELLGVSKWTVRHIATELGAVKANAQGDEDGRKRYGHLAFQEEGLVERYQEYLRTK